MIRDWANLPGPLLDSVVERLASPADFFWFSLVCKSWYSIAKDNESKLSRITTPMLLVCANKRKAWNVYNIREKKLLDLQPSLPNKRYCGSSKGWLITMEKDFRIILINPFQRKKEDSIIRLPPLPIRHVNNPGYDLKCTLSADPVLNANDCVLIVAYGNHRCMSFIRVGKDATWTGIGRNWEGIVDLAYFEGRVYALTQECRFFSFDITIPHRMISDIQLFDHNIGRNPCQKYLVISNEKELLMIYRIIGLQITTNEYGGPRRNHVTMGFEIFEFNLEECEWKRKDTLDDTALFLGDTSAISVPVSSSSGCEPNCIYFCRDMGFDSLVDDMGFDSLVDENFMCVEDFGGYNLETKSFFEPYTMEARTLAENSAWPTVWVMPPKYRL